MALEISKDGGLTRPKFLDRVLRLRKAALIIALVGAYFYAQWCFDPANMEVTRISEHSLMPGLVTPKFDKSGVATQMYRKLKDLPRGKTQKQFILDTFKEFGLQGYIQKWKSTVAAVPMSGENVYGFIRGYRNDGAEAQLIVVQLGKSESALRMISRMLAFIDYAKDQVYWARDFVFAFVDGGVEESIEKAAFAMDTFLLKYQKIESLSNKNSTRKTVIADEIQEQTGALIAGVVYDLSGMAVKGQHIINIQTNGLNGQQVNLDVFNGIVKIADSKHHSKVAIFGNLHRHASPYADYSPYTVPMKAIYTQAFIPIEGIHSVMGKYGVQGLTVGLSHDYSERQTGQFIEEVSRMLNNVLERLHQSYFMYVLSDDMHFASIAFYIPVIGILLCPLVVSAYYEWTKISEFQMPFACLLFHLIGFFIYFTTTVTFETYGLDIVFQSINFPFIGIDGCDGQLTPPIPLIYIYLLLASIPIGFPYFLKYPVGCIHSTRFICLLETSLILGCLSLLNNGLSVLCAGVIVPIVFMMTFGSGPKNRMLVRTSILVFLSPVGVMTYLAMNAPSLFGDPRIGVEPLLKTVTRLIYTMMEHHVMFGVQNFFLMSVFGYALWNLLFGCALHYNNSPDGEEEEQTPPSDPKPSKKHKQKTH